MDEPTVEQARALDLIFDPNAKEDYYTMLELPNELSLTEPIKKSYRRMSFLLHPDKNPDPRATEAFQKLSNVNQALNTEKLLEQYDRYYIFKNVLPPTLIEILGPNPEQSHIGMVRLGLELVLFPPERNADFDFLFVKRTPEEWAQMRFEIRRIKEVASEALKKSSETEASEVGNEIVSGTFRDTLTRYLTLPHLFRLFILLMRICLFVSFILHTGSLIQKISNEFIWKVYTVGPLIYSTKSMILSTLYHSIKLSEVFICLRDLLYIISPFTPTTRGFRLILMIGDFLGMDTVRPLRWLQSWLAWPLSWAIGGIFGVNPAECLEIIQGDVCLLIYLWLFWAIFRFPSIFKKWTGAKGSRPQHKVVLSIGG